MTSTGICKVWVQDAPARVSVRADRIVAVRVVAVNAFAEDGQHRWRLEVVTLDPITDGASTVVPLCFGVTYDFETDAPGRLLTLIGRHIDDPDGGVIDSCNEDTALELDKHGHPSDMFQFTSFAQNAKNRPRPVPSG